MTVAGLGSFPYSITPRTWMCIQYTPGVASVCKDVQILKLVFLSVDTVAVSGSPCHDVWRNPGVWTRSADGMRPRRCLLQEKRKWPSSTLSCSHFSLLPKRSLSSHTSTLEGSKRQSVPFPFWFLKQGTYPACCLSLTRKAINSGSTPGREGFCS